MANGSWYALSLDEGEICCHHLLLVTGFVLHMNYLFIIRLVNVKKNNAMTLDCKKYLDIKKSFNIFGNFLCFRDLYKERAAFI